MSVQHLKKRSGHMKSVAFVWVIGLEILPHINSECSFINQSPLHFFVRILELHFEYEFPLAELPLCVVVLQQKYLLEPSLKLFVFLRDVRDQNQWIGSPPCIVIWCDLMLIQIEFCIVFIGPVFPCLEDVVGSVIAEEIQNIQVKQQDRYIGLKW